MKFFNNKKNSKWIYLPIETKAREFHAKILLAVEACKSGFSVVIGQKNVLNKIAHKFPPGLFLNFGLASNFAGQSAMLHRIGHKVWVIDEEGLVSFSDEIYKKVRVTPKAIAHTDMVFCWGKHQYKLIQERTQNSTCQVFSTGNPRFDLLHPIFREVFRDEADLIRQKYGDFILVNTNFSAFNHFNGLDFALQSYKNKGFIEDLGDENFFKNRIKWQGKNLGFFVEMIFELSKVFKNLRFVVRPHPSENKNVWEKEISSLPNVCMDCSGNVIPWLIAANVLIQNNCTTAVESYLLGTPVISYMPVIDKDQELELPKSISDIAVNIEEVKSLIKTYLCSSKSIETSEKHNFLRIFIEEKENSFAFQRIVQTLDKNSIDIIDPKIFTIPQIKLSGLWDYFKMSIKKLRRNGTDYVDEKFPELRKIEILELTKKYKFLMKYDFDVEAVELMHNCFFLHKKDY